ncbi:hypothetical protein RsoM2USA_301 [Ralstonia phage RsoM2USA]|nr:hypothetical protein RsoM2USA_301 [Ralstonia phage RsoM2USA]
MTSQEQYAEVVQWIGLNVRRYGQRNVHDSLVDRYGRYHIVKDGVDFTGTGLPFSKPSFLEINSKHLTFENYDFENSQYGGVGQISTAFMTLEFCKGDLEKVVRQTAPMRIDFLNISAKFGEFTNLVAATQVSDHVIFRVSRPNSSSSILEISTITNVAIFKGKQSCYFTDVFDLQNILIDNGFEDLV